MGKRLILSLACLFAVFATDAQNGWHLKKDQEGIRIYSRNSDSNRIADIKVELIVTGRLSSLAALVLDIDNYPNWSFNTEKAYVLRRIGPADLYFYSLIRSPWPASMRDLAVHLRLRQDSATRTLRILADESPDYIPARKGIVRVPVSIERWTVTPLPGEKLSITYELRLDPGASVPSWLIDMFSTRGPFETFSKLRTAIREPKYRNAALHFIRN